MLIIRRFALSLGVILLFFSSGAFAQDHGEVGAFFDYFRFTQANDLNMFGVGGRVGVNVHPNVALEVEGAYDFARSTNITVGALGDTVRTNFRVTTFLAGPKFQLGKSSAWRLYGVLKGGFVRFGVTPGPVTFGTFPTQLDDTDLNGAFHPAGGVEAFAGILGIRDELGDLIYFDNGAHNNLRVTIGPMIRS